MKRNPIGLSLVMFSLLLTTTGAYSQSGAGAQKVVFTGDDFTVAWQSQPQFTANTNWIGAGVTTSFLDGGSDQVLAAFETNVINKHPQFVHIMTGTTDLNDIHDSTPVGVVWNQWQQAVTSMVQMAQKAGIKVILGNVPSNVSFTNNYSEGVQVFNAWLENYGLANKIPVLNYHDALCGCVGSGSTTDLYAPSLSVQPNPDPSNPTTQTPNAAGYALISQMAQVAIDTYGLTIKGGYLSNVEAYNEFDGSAPESQVNDVAEGEVVIFTPQAKWSDGVTRPVLNKDFLGLTGGTWTSSDPGVMYITPGGYAYAYKAGTATISYKAPNGTTFSPWKMTVETVYGVI